MLLAMALLAASALGSAQAAPLFTDRLTGEAIDARIDPAAYEIAATAVRSGELPSDMSAKRVAFDKLARDLAGEPETVMRVENLKAGAVPIRLYRPGEGLMPAIIFTHGGSFEKGSLDSHDAPLRLLANRCHCVVLAVDYRLAPEHKHPVQIEDAYTVLRWAAANAKALEILPDQFVVAGDGAGGNLAAMVALRARDERGPKIIYQALFYPATDLSLGSETWRRFGGGPWANAADEAKALRERYLPAGLDPKDPRVSPLYADLKGLPPAFVAVTEFSGYRDEGQAYAARLRAAGVPAEGKAYAGQLHDFLLMTGRVEASRQLIDDVAARLRRAFGYVE
jgi:acetyl esterase